MAWYNTYRPTTFDDVIGQDLIKSVLKNALKKKKIKHAYLFSGPKGIGKTTLARIFANSLNEIDTAPQAAIDIVEMDAASNTGIDNIRQLIDSAKTPPMYGSYKIFIIDEVHMLSKAAMNALLKILEEPPTYLVFLLATTNPEKILPTVLSRLTKLTLHAHTVENLIERLDFICQKEKLNIDQDSLKLIAKRAQGSQRDSINLLETIASYDLESYTITETSQLLGLLPEDLLQQTAQMLLSGSLHPQMISEIESTGIDGEGFLAQFLEFLIDRQLGEGSREYQNLVLPVATVLDLRLPLSTVPMALALIQLHLGVNGNIPINASVTSKPPMLSKLTEQEKVLPKTEEIPESIKSEPKENQSTQKETTDSEDTIHSDPQQNEPLSSPASQSSSTESAVSIEKIQANIMALPAKNDAPPILKMIVPDLIVEGFANNELELSVSNGIFFGQLNSQKIQTYIKSQLHSVLSYQFKIKPILRQYQEKPKSKIPAPKETIAKPEPEDNSPENSTTTAPKPKQSNTIFYSVYKQLPINMDGKGVGVKNPPIHIPESSHGNWDDHAESMFELEE